MPIRLSGLASNMDTDSIIKELMKAQGLKKTKVENKLTKLEWTKDIWKDMNSKIYKFYTGPLSKLKTQGSFATKKATSSNESKVTVKAGTGAATGSHNVQVNKLASAQYVTGFKLDKDKNEIEVTGKTTLEDLGFAIDDGSQSTDGSKNEIVIKINNSGKTTNLYVTAETTLNDLVNACAKAGLNASYDNTQKRLFISTKESGIDNYFEMTTDTVVVTADREEVRNLLGYHNEGTSGSARFQMDQTIDTYTELLAITDRTKEQQKAFDEAEKKLKEYTKSNTIADVQKDYDSLTSNVENIKCPGKIEEEIRDKYKDLTNPPPEETILAEINEAVDSEKSKYVKYKLDEYEKINSGELPSTVTNRFYDNQTKMLGALKSAGIKDATNKIDNNNLDDIGIGTITVTDNVCSTSISGNKVSIISSDNSEIIYNGAKLEGTSNQVTVNGVTFELHGVTGENEKVTLTVANDTDAVYDMVRNFVKGYNELLQEMNKLYNADSARGFNPLTEDEKGSMTDSQIEKWEQKIKDSLLRRDDNLSGLLSSMRSNMAGSVTVNGKNLSLSTFGIVTGVYTEKGLLHINGDGEDPIYGGYEDKLKKALEENPEDVMAVLNKLADNLYQDMSNKMKGTSLRSALTVYNDKEMAKLEKSYKKDIATLEKKLKEVENRYYKQFTAMETAMSKLNSQSGQLSSMLGL
ncbi:flagellar filament capping protein FliD [Lachnoclostridium phytofermentans]|uniref:Flagellar hook-associated protein 2 n=1 Tax=Lachnoclostridium phytofermentans (strain ATCC 700394 / DSM 18823 / ISDg) TaxID=357809 RepID=A9KSQ5_LACP7|nr:flagellar filament capping protein FliD [Lachnoclostridium phytofermentans]ABX40699.1 flagellar hook-associated 2 domain protein [Lachnoclostridium phytofermentans ISDg]